MRPNPLIIRRYLTRSARFWLAVRAVSGVILAFAGSDPLRFSVGASINVFLLSIAVGFVEIGVRREWALLGNLGMSPLLIGCIFAVPAAIGEGVVRLFAAAM